MSPAQVRSRARSKKKKSIPRWLVVMAPLLVGIVVTPFAVRAASVLAMSGPEALRLLYPFLPLASQHFTSSPDDPLVQWIMYGQFPVYGVIWMVMGRVTRGAGGALSVLALHCLGVAAAILTASAS